MKDLKELNLIEDWWDKIYKPIVEQHPDAISYYTKNIPQMLGCDLKDVVMLEVINPNYDKGVERGGEYDFEDEEGWDVKAFFPEGSEIKRNLINADYQLETFCIGEVGTLFYEGVMFYYEVNASPFGIWGNKNKIIKNEN